MATVPDKLGPGKPIRKDWKKIDEIIDSLGQLAQENAELRAMVLQRPTVDEVRNAGVAI